MRPEEYDNLRCKIEQYGDHIVASKRLEFEQKKILIKKLNEWDDVLNAKVS